MDMLRATGQIYHAKNLHSTRSTSKAKRNAVSESQWARGGKGGGVWGSKRGLELHICLLEWQKLAEGVQNERFS